jgi:hypothetical protein
LSDRERFPEELEDLPAEPVRPEDEASAARSCLIILLLVVILLAILVAYLIATAVT